MIEKSRQSRRAIMLVVDDSEADRILIRNALEDKRVRCDLVELQDGEELLSYLRREPPYDNAERYPDPDLVLLDINMPRINGKQALKSIRQNLGFAALPIVMFTTSQHDVDVMESYALGVNAYVSKPLEAQAFIDTIAQIEQFWFELVVLPHRHHHR